MARLGGVSRDDSLLGAAAALPAVHAALGVQAGVVNVLLLLFLLGLVVVSADPRAAVVEGRILARQVVAALGAGADVVAAALRQGARARRQLGGNGGVGRDPVGEGVLAVLDDGLAGLVAIVRLPRLAGGDGGVVDELEEVLAVAGDDGDLLAVLAQGVELIGVGGLDLLAGDVGQLGLGDQGLGLGTDKLLLENDNLGRVGLLVLELSNLVGDLLLACCGRSILHNAYTRTGRAERTVAAGLDRGLNVADALHGDAVLVVAVDVLVLELADLVEEDAELVGDVRDILVAALAPDGELLLGNGQRVSNNGREGQISYSDLHALLGYLLQASHDVLLHLDELGQLLGQVGPEGAAGIAAEGMACAIA